MYYASMFSGAGIAELMLEQLNLKSVVASEIIPNRAKLYKHFFPESSVVVGDITEKETYESFINIAKANSIELLIATPPCQGFSLAGKNKNQTDMLNDNRNFLIFKVIDAIIDLEPKFVLIENVPRFLKLYYPFNNQFRGVVDLLHDIFQQKYDIHHEVLNSKNFCVPQSRKRSFIFMTQKSNNFNWPTKALKIITVRDAIGHLPSLESNEKSDIKWHFGRKHTESHIALMKNTPTGKSAFQNLIHYPKNKEGKRIKGFPATYSRISWDQPAPTITIRNDAISSQTNVHPGRLLNNGFYSDARVLSVYELMILSSIPTNIDIPNWVSEILLRQVIGESVPPLLVYKILQEALS